MILAGGAAALHIGKLPPALPVLQAALHISLVQAGFLLSLAQLAGMSLWLAVGLVTDGLGLKRSVLTGLVLLGMGSAAGGFATDAPMHADHARGRGPGVSAHLHARPQPAAPAHRAAPDQPRVRLLGRVHAHRHVLGDASRALRDARGGLERVVVAARRA
ncbi:MAG: hypothetical protein MO853_13775 [Candidatus Protistobacter heckmanni]|nr:hypothetical protein [Candidatus Protistobacter heckmanni]